MYEDIIREVKGGRNLADIMTEIQKKIDMEDHQEKKIAAAREKVKDSYYDYMSAIAGVEVDEEVKKIFGKLFDRLFEDMENTTVKVKIKDGSGSHAKERSCKKNPDEVIRAFLKDNCPF